eukprot:4623845-Prorocentrum_lima.AAC.1
MPVRRHTLRGGSVEPDLGLSAVEGEPRSGPCRCNRVESRLDLGERQDEVEVVDVGHNSNLRPLPPSGLSTTAGY